MSQCYCVLCHSHVSHFFVLGLERIKCIDGGYSGYSFNLDGGTIYMSLGAIFCAQAGGMSLPIATQLSIMGTLMLTSKGIAAVPRGSMIIMAGTISQVK